MARPPIRSSPTAVVRALGAPFTERFFDLAQQGTRDRAAGFVGLIDTQALAGDERGEQQRPHDDALDPVARREARLDPREGIGPAREGEDRGPQQVQGESFRGLAGPGQRGEQAGGRAARGHSAMKPGRRAPVAVRRLTSHPGVEGRPRFSPDGNKVIMSLATGGNTDIYVVDSRGGIPTRLLDVAPRLRNVATSGLKCCASSPPTWCPCALIVGNLAR